MTIRLEGTIVPGTNQAKLTLPMQLAEFVKQRPELAVCRAGTINIKLDKPFRVAKPDFRIGPLFYLNGFGESYGFVSVLIEIPLGATGQTAWIYLPDGSPHVGNVWQIELIAPQIDAANLGMRCRLHINRNFETATVLV